MVWEKRFRGLQNVDDAESDYSMVELCLTLSGGVRGGGLGVWVREPLSCIQYSIVA